MCWWLAEELSSQGPVVIVDADVGQSRVGPPACVGWVEYGAQRGEFEFVGDVSPARRLATAVSATVRMALRGQRIVRPRWLIVDTTGYVDGPGAAQLKTAKIQLLAPVTVIAVAPRGRLEHLRWPWRGREEVRWLHLNPAPACSSKTIDQRQRWRQELFARWLNGSRQHEFELDHLALQHFPPKSHLERMREDGQVEGLLVGVDDERGIGLCLGLLEDVQMENTYVRIWAPPEAEGARGLRLGAIRLNPDGSPREGRPLAWQDNS